MANQRAGGVKSFCASSALVADENKILFTFGEGHAGLLCLSGERCALMTVLGGEATMKSPQI